MNNVINLTKMSLINLKAVYKQIYYVWIIWIGIAIFNPFFLNILLGISVLLTLYQVMAYEDNNNVDYLISYLPVKKSEYVISRYLFGIISILLSLIVILVVYFISININSAEKMPLELLLPTNIISAVLSVAVIIPLVLRFGINKGRVLMTMIVMVISTIPVSIVSKLNETPDIINNIISIISKIGLPILSIILSIVALLISIFISLKLYLNKEIKE
ncbi:ABC-2 transporter permease [Clostridium sp. AL.422]|uniref:ABC-2 transporter permease n=1 Tax=Clostridium TaxID=1485 RepID=UPI00293DBFAE|nr:MULTISPECIES: ABC-2 transporter permease [unclassified Clostridium]MDV4151448.1 ABC-2 transporter permease [Clostridium sp. AL.422]